MKIRGMFCLVVALSFLGLFPDLSVPQETKAGGMLAHMVYFDLKDASAPARAKLVSDCRRYLKSHPGIVFFATGTIAEDFNRDVNVRDFHVSLHLVFKTKADHERYQAAPAHQRFIQENSANWARVRVFDCYVD